MGLWLTRRIVNQKVAVSIPGLACADMTLVAELLSMSSLTHLVHTDEFEICKKNKSLC